MVLRFDGVLDATRIIAEITLHESCDFRLGLMKHSERNDTLNGSEDEKDFRG